MDASAQADVFSVKKYKPDTGFEPAGLAALLLALAVAGAVLGFIANYVSQWFYLILVFPAGIGLALGFVGGFVVTKTKTRNPMLCALAGLLGGIFAMTAMHYASYMDFKNQMSDPAIEDEAAEIAVFANMSESQREKALTEMEATEEDREYVETAISAYLALDSFPAFMNFAATQGVSIGRATSSGGGANIGFVGSYIYWILEMLLVAGIVLFAVRNEASQPFCKKCHEWKEPVVLGTLQGTADQGKAVVASGNIAEMRGLSPTPEWLDEGTRVTLHACARCQASETAVVYASQISLDNKGNQNEKNLAKIAYPGEAAEALRQTFAEAESLGTVDPVDPNAPLG